MASSTPPDANAMMKEILDALKTLQLNQVQLASAVDAISGRVNVLAGMKEVREVAASTPPKKAEPVDDAVTLDNSVPESPSLPATTLDGEVSTGLVSTHGRKTSTGTSRIILT
jgi:hypothetical protein